MFTDEWSNWWPLKSIERCSVCHQLEHSFANNERGLYTRRNTHSHGSLVSDQTKNTSPWRHASLPVKRKPRPPLHSLTSLQGTYKEGTDGLRVTGDSLLVDIWSKCVLPVTRWFSLFLVSEAPQTWMKLTRICPPTAASSHFGDKFGPAPCKSTAA